MIRLKNCNNVSVFFGVLLGTAVVPRGLMAQQLTHTGPSTKTVSRPGVPNRPVSVNAASPQLVAEGTIQRAGEYTRALLVVTIHGHPGTVLLDLGSTGWIVSSSDSAFFGITGIPNGVLLDSLSFGTAVEHQLIVHRIGIDESIPPGMPLFAGILGQEVLSHYELLFDGPAHRVRLYRPLPDIGAGARSGTDPRWLPAGFTAADCLPMVPFGDATEHWVGLMLQVNGHRIPSYFDSGSSTAAMNVSAAKRLGLTQHAPNVHRVVESMAISYPIGGGREIYDATDVTLQLGSHTLTPLPVKIMTRIPVQQLAEGTPLLTLGMQNFSDRVLLISYQTRQVCISPN